jgi:glycosyltransferase involved in cell wall biosynthesis
MNLQSLISIIIPVHNGSTWIDQCFNGILEQQLAPDTQIEICVCNDASNDNTVDLLKKWNILLQNKIPLKIYNNESGKPKGGKFTIMKCENFNMLTFSWILQK